MLLRILVLLLVVRLALRFLAGVARGLSGETRSPAGAQGGVELVRDEVCGTFVPRSQALQATVGGQPRHFCSARCRDKALAAVAR